MPMRLPEQTVIRSPIDGVVIGRKADRGQTVAASLQAPTLFTIAQDLRHMDLHARVDETVIGHIRVGRKATFKVGVFPQRQFTAQVSETCPIPAIPCRRCACLGRCLAGLFAGLPRLQRRRRDCRWPVGARHEGRGHQKIAGNELDAIVVAGKESVP
jgi:hypothetical protein